MTRFSAIMKRAIIFSASLLAMLFSAACSASAPEIMTVSSRIFVGPSNSESGRVESLSFFVAVRDEDGLADIESLYLIQNDDEIYWRFDPSTWTRRDEGSEIWIGSNGISMVDGAAIPRAQYRVLVIDKSGNRAERRVQIAAASSSGARLPGLSVSANSVDVNSPYEGSLLLFLDSEGETIAAVKAKNGLSTMDSLFGSNSWKDSVKSVLVQSFDERIKLGYLSWKRTIE